MHGFRFTGGVRCCFSHAEPLVCSSRSGLEAGLCVAFSCSCGFPVSWHSQQFAAAGSTSRKTRYFLCSSIRSSSVHTVDRGRCGNSVQDCTSACSACSSSLSFSREWLSALTSLPVSLPEPGIQDADRADGWARIWLFILLTCTSLFLANIIGRLAFLGFSLLSVAKGLGGQSALCGGLDGRCY